MALTAIALTRVQGTGAIDRGDPVNVVITDGNGAAITNFWQTTQPVSGTFWQATQPISGTVTANAGSGTFAVSIASMPSTPVTGTFWQATQPISGTVTVTQTISNTTTGDTGAKTATGQGGTQTNTGAKSVQIVLQLGTVSGTAPTCTFKVQDSADGGTTWVDVPGAATASLTATGNFGIKIYPGIAVTAGSTTSNTTAGANQVLGRAWRVVWTIGGTAPSFTITSIQYTYLVN